MMDVTSAHEMKNEKPMKGGETAAVRRYLEKNWHSVKTEVAVEKLRLEEEKQRTAALHADAGRLEKEAVTERDKLLN